MWGALQDPTMILLSVATDANITQEFEYTAVGPKAAKQSSVAGHQHLE